MKKIRRSTIIFMVITLVVVVLISVGGYLLYNSYYYYSTDDAQVTGNIVNIVPTVSGTLTSLSVQIGDDVSTNQIIGTIKITNSTATTKLTAPFDGVIVQVPGVIGQTVSPGVPIALETNLSGVNVTAYIDEGSLKSIFIGQPVDIHVDSYSGTNFTGHVSQIVNATASQFSLLPTQDNASSNFTKVGQRIPIIITPDNNNGPPLLPGMSVEVTIHIR